ncbi:hypothetical protein L7F22_062302 [Adiantum nelumboides]|nr:hypothetical protein [Adiantum nelumboides]
MPVRSPSGCRLLAHYPRTFSRSLLPLPLQSPTLFRLTSLRPQKFALQLVRPLFSVPDDRNSQPGDFQPHEVIGFNFFSCQALFETSQGQTAACKQYNLRFIMPIDPYWRYATRGGAYAVGGGSRKWKYNFCGYEKTGSMTQVKDHLGKVPGKDVLICQHVPNDVLALLEGWRRQRLGVDTGSDDVEQVMQTHVLGEASSSRVAPSKRTRVESDADSVLASSSVGEGPSARRTPLLSVEVPARGSLQRASITASFQKQAMKEATREVTRFLIKCVISFNVARTSKWKKTMRTVSRIGCEWKGPSSETLRT